MIPKGAKDILSFCPVSLHLLLTCACKTEQREHNPAKHPHTKTDQPDRSQPQPYQRTTTATRKKKNTGAGAEPWCRCRGRCTDRGRRACPGRRDTRGNPNPKWVWVSPAPERERKRENVVGNHTKQTKKERGQTNIWANNGQVLKGTKPNMIPIPETKNAIQTNLTNNPKALNKKNQSPVRQSLGGIITAGWRGPWAALRFLRRHPGGPWYRGVRGPPHHGNRPRWRKN